MRGTPGAACLQAGSALSCISSAQGIWHATGHRGPGSSGKLILTAAQLSRHATDNHGVSMCRALACYHQAGLHVSGNLLPGAPSLGLTRPTASHRHQFPAMLEAKLRESHRRKRTRDDEGPAGEQQLGCTSSTTGASQRTSGAQRLAHAPQSSPSLGAAAAGNAAGGRGRRRSTEERPSKRRSRESVDTPKTPRVAATGAVAALRPRFESGLPAAASSQGGEVAEAAGPVVANDSKVAVVRAWIDAELAQAAGRRPAPVSSMGAEVAEVARQKAANRQL